MRLLPSQPAERWLAAGNLVNMTGTGATLSVLVIFLDRARDLPLTTAATLLALTGLVGVAGAIPVGQWCDRYGAREVAVMTELVSLAATAALLFANGFWPLALCLSARQLATSGNTVARATLMGKLVPPDRRTGLRAYQRSVTNIGISLGAVISAVAVASGYTAALLAVLAFDAATFAFSAFATGRLPTVGRGDRRPGFVLDAVSDGGYVVAGILNALHALNRTIVSAGVPLWVVYGSSLPAWAVSVALILNTVTVICLQVPLSVWAAHLRGAARSLAAAGALTGGGCAILALAMDRPAPAAWALFVTAAVSLALGEILGAAGGWTVSYDLAPDRRLGQYQGLWQLMSDGSAKAVGPALAGWAVAAGVAGWAGLAAIFGGLALLTPRVIGWSARRTRAMNTST